MRTDDQGDVWRLSSETVVSQSDFGIKPYSQLLGALKVADDVTVSFTARGPRTAGTRTKGMTMRIGVVFPQTEIGGSTPARFGTTPNTSRGWGMRTCSPTTMSSAPIRRSMRAGTAPYDVHNTFHEPLVMFGYLAAVTSSLELVTGVVILPQRQTVLVAKQAAEVDLLSGGRLRLGVGLGWNTVEYEALGEDFSNRGKRCGEQVELMRKLWTEDKSSAIAATTTR